MKPDIGISDDNRAHVADALAQVLADTYALYQKTHLYHWNVQGPRFIALHEMFGKQYDALWTSLDEIAERIRSLGVLAPTHADLAKRTSLAADTDPAPSEDAMIAALLAGNETLIQSARAALHAAAAAGDEASADLMTTRCADLEKTAWMLRAHLPA
jgi:starvation-inducible DNA-binding protein